MLDPRVLDKMLPSLKQSYGNASSTEHAYGWEANDCINLAREQISDLIRCSPNEIIFTSGATESNNIAILGFLQSYNIKNADVITLKTEHKSVLDIFNSIQNNNVLVNYLDVMTNVLIDIDKFNENINSNTKLVSIMMVNNEIGVIQPIEKIGEICKNKGIVLHVDAAQALGKIDINLKKLKVDLMSMSAHKLHGPKGVGCIYINSETMRNKINPLTFGGGHERGLRPGTLATHNIIGFGEACSIANNEIKKDYDWIKSLKNIFIEKIFLGCDDVIINGCLNKRIPGNLNITFQGLNQQSLIPYLKKVAVSSGSACTTSTPTPSHVLSALGIKKSLIASTIRIGIGKFNTINEIELASEHIINVVNKLKINNKEVING